MSGDVSLFSISSYHLWEYNPLCILAGFSYVDHPLAGIFSQSHYDQATDGRFGSVQKDPTNVDYHYYTNYQTGYVVGTPWGDYSGWAGIFSVIDGDDARDVNDGSLQVKMCKNQHKIHLCIHQYALRINHT